LVYKTDNADTKPALSALKENMPLQLKFDYPETFIQLAINENIQTVCIDEVAGRRIARLNGLSVTGTIGILLRAKREGYPISVQQSIHRMLDRGIRLSATVITFALEQASEGS
jgi:predicted nucleic acid-binding protein